MSGTVDQFIALCQAHGSDFTYRRQQSLTVCPCRSPQGFRDDLWHRTDQPGIPQLSISSGAGNLTGTFTYRVHNVYNQGEKFGEEATSPAVIAKDITVSWEAAEPRPVAGRGPAIAYKVYRKSQSTEDWLLVAEITDLTITSIVDNTIDGGLTIGNPILSICNEAGYLVNPSDTTTVNGKGFIHPVQSGAVRRLTTEVISEIFGEVQADDHLGIMPCVWNGTPLDFTDWGQSLEDRITYNGKDYTVVSDNLIPDPADGNPFHHYEVGLRLL